MASDAKPEIAARLLALVPEGQTACAHHPAQAADGLCSACSQLCCWECVTYDLEADALLCATCQQALALKRRRAHQLRFLRMPAFYITLTVIASVVAWACGVGNPRPAILARQDAKRPEWFSRVLPYEWLTQAMRVRKRLDMLDGVKGREVEYRAWARLEQQAFHHMAEGWKEAPVLPDILMAEAVMRAGAGEPIEALADLAKLGGRLSGNQQVAWLYYQGKIALAMGDRPAAVKFWNQVLENITPDQEGGMTTAEAIERMFSPYSNVRPEPVVTQNIRDVCRSDIHPVTAKNRIREQGRKQGLKLIPPKKRPNGDNWEGQDDAGETAPAVPGTTQPSPAPAGPLKIERFD